VAKVDTAMTFGISRDQGLFEWAGTSLSALFAQRKNVISPSFWRMIFDILRFNQFALDLLSDAADGGLERGASAKSSPYVVESSQESIGQYLEREGYSESFKNDYLIPMTACVWSTSPDKCSLDFPAITLVRFLWNHHLLSTVGARPTWMTVKDGSHRYVEAILKDVPPERIHLRKGAKSLRGKVDGKVQLSLDDGGMEVFDHVILATHGDTAADIIKDSATAEELSIMSRFKTSSNVAVLHSDTSVRLT
jgi:predicted NAD/FAD-binding protein